ncbi:MAG: glycosyltransferase [Burkholderiaceae bacterium]|nr:glycosyltransferase [Burkholderiaceae bacterium]
MRVLQLSKFYAPIRGGIETVAWELSEGLARAGVRADVLCSNQHRLNTRERYEAGYEVLRAASWGMLLSTSLAPAMARHLRRIASDYELLHVHMPDPMAAMAIWLAKPQCALVVHWHSDVIRQRRALKLYEPLQRWLLQRADAVIATSQPYADASPALQPWREKIEVIPIGISERREQACHLQTEALRQRFGGRRIVFSLGRMTYYKGFDVLIQAALELPDDCVVLIGGDGEMLAHNRALVESLGLADKVHLLGHVNDGELPSHYAACEVFCMSSTVRSEAYGVAMVEAMAMGKPIVATDIVGSGVPWVNRDGHTGYNVPVRQPAALAAALRRLLSDSTLRQRMGEAARHRYQQSFNATQMTHRTLALYQRLLAPASGAPSERLDERLNWIR